MCKADPPGWRGNGQWYKGGPNYNHPHVMVWGEYDGHVRVSCLYCGKWMTDENKLVQSEGETVTTGDQE